MGRHPTLEFIRNVIREESVALGRVADAVDDSYLKAVELIQNSLGKVVITGIGKSGHIAQKIAATMTSTGTLALFLHPSDAQHGDLGVVGKSDVVICLSKSGESDELLMVLPSFKKIGTKLIAITAAPASSLAKAADVVISSGIEQEAGHLALAPTTSTTVSLAIGDAIAMALMKLKNFKPEDFALYHPGGQLGRQLLLNLSDLMIPLVNCPVLDAKKCQVDEVISLLGSAGLGIVLFTSGDGKLDGIVTDGDVRRALSQKKSKIFEMSVNDLMNVKPTTVSSSESAMNALKIMEDRPRPLNVVPVIDGGALKGIVRLHELLKLKASPR